MEAGTRERKTPVGTSVFALILALLCPFKLQAGYTSLLWNLHLVKEPVDAANLYLGPFVLPTTMMTTVNGAAEQSDDLSQVSQVVPPMIMTMTTSGAAPGSADVSPVNMPTITMTAMSGSAAEEPERQFSLGENGSFSIGGHETRDLSRFSVINNVSHDFNAMTTQPFSLSSQSSKKPFFVPNSASKAKKHGHIFAISNLFNKLEQPRQEKKNFLYDSSIVALAVLNIADYVTTKEALKHERLVESNPLVRAYAKNEVLLTAVKIGWTVAHYHLMKSLYKKNTKLAWIVSAISNIALGYIVANNIRLIHKAKSL